MAQGLQVWNASGQLIYDTPDRLSRVMGTFTVPAATGGGSVTLPTGYGSYWYHIQALDGSRYTCNVSVSGNTLTYSASSLFGPAVDCLVLYGAY